jgi:hypothetical protein
MHENKAHAPVAPILTDFRPDGGYEMRENLGGNRCPDHFMTPSPSRLDALYDENTLTQKIQLVTHRVACCGPGRSGRMILR